MKQSALLVQSIRGALRERGMTYRQLAAAIGVSEPTVKRDLSRGDFPLRRLDAICDLLQLSLAELSQGRLPGRELLTQLSAVQERALVREPRLLLLTYLLVNGWRWEEILLGFDFDENSLTSALLRLDQLKIVDFRPPRRIKKLTARNFAWRRDGPVHEFFIGRVAPEFLRGHFDATGELFQFLGGLISSSSRAQLHAKLAALVEEFEHMARQDARLPLSERDSCSLMIAMRQWEYSAFTGLRRKT